MSFNRMNGMLLAIIVFSSTLCWDICAQSVETQPLRGFMPNRDQLSDSVDNIDIASGKLNLQIPLGSLPRGRGGSGWKLNLQYDSRFYELFPGQRDLCDGGYCDRYDYAYVNPYGNGGWSYDGAIPYDVIQEEKIFVSYDMPVEKCPDRTVNYYRQRLVLPDGSSHILYASDASAQRMDSSSSGYYGVGKYYCTRYLGWAESWPADTMWYTKDGTYVKTDTSGRFYFPDGRIAYSESGVRKLRDANGNRIAFEGCGYSIKPVTSCRIRHDADTNEERFLNIDYGTVPSGGTWRRDLVTVPGPNGKVSWSIDWQKITIQYTYATGITPSGHATPSDGILTVNRDIWVIRYIQLPTLTHHVPLGQVPPAAYSYEFDYESTFGMLSYMRIPSGATYEYSYGIRHVYSDPIYPGVHIANGTYVSSKKVTHDAGDPLQWTFENDSLKTVITNPDGGRTTYHYSDKDGLDWDSGLVKKIEEMDKNGTRKSERTRSWIRTFGGYAPHIPNNPQMSKEVVGVFDANGNGVRKAATTYEWDGNGNLLDKKEYDWVAYSVANDGTVKRRTKYDYWITAETTYAKMHPVGTARRLDAVRRVTVFEGLNNPKAATEYVYDDPFGKGNVTVEKHWDSTKVEWDVWSGTVMNSNSNSQEFRYFYDSYGNLIEKREPSVSGNTPRTRITYDSTGSYVEQVDTGYETPVQRSVLYDWGNNGVAIKTQKDVENNLITEYYYDAVGRNTKVQEKHGDTNLRLIQTIYDDVNRIMTTKNDLLEYGDGILQTVTYYDQLGRVKLAQTSEGPGAWITAATNDVYLTGGRRVITTTPYRTLSDPTLEMTCTQYDTLGRVTQVATFKGSVPPTRCDSTTNRTGVTSMSYNAEWTTVTDPDGKVRKERVDVLGRLVEVVEDPSGLNYVTTYEYDVLNNLTRVYQGGQTRTFTYNSLSWLISATNPESGTIYYTYHDSGDLKTKTDARQKQTTIEYDVLGRIKTKTYSDGTPGVTYVYYTKDDAPNAGMLKSVNTSAATTSYTYDIQGRPKKSSHTIEGRAGTMTFQYDWYLSGALKKETYPSGKEVDYDLDDAGRTSRAYFGSTNYADLRSSAVGSNAYTADGRKAKVKLGNGLYETYDYRPAGTVTKYMLGTSLDDGDLTQLEYYFSGSNNNGNVTRHVVQRNINQIWTQNYQYDGVNRLVDAHETGGWNRTYGYDRYGNRWVESSTGMAYEDGLEPTPLDQFNTSKNQLYGVSYDDAGNQTSYDGLTLEYDAEGRNTKVKDGSSDYVTFTYDGEGRRVKKISGGITTYYVYDALGQLAAEYSNGGAVLPTPGAPVLSVSDSYITVSETRVDRTHFKYQFKANVTNTGTEAKNVRAVVTGKMSSNVELLDEELTFGTVPAGATVTSTDTFTLLIDRLYPIEASLEFVMSYEASDAKGANVTYLFTDMLGSVRTITNGDGKVVECYDYMPFGRMLTSADNGRNAIGCHPAAPDPSDSRVSQKFSGKERDVETGLDYFGARYMSGPEGRFMSPDPLLNSGRPNNPQTWNRYAYVLNNPLRFIDPTGLWEWEADTCAKDDKKCQEKRTADQNWFRDAVNKLEEALMMAKDDPDLWYEVAALNEVRALIGSEGDKGYIVSFDTSKIKGQAGGAQGKHVYLDSSIVTNRINEWAGRDKSFDFRTESAGAVVHEFGHKLDFGKAKNVLDTDLLRMNERQAYRFQSHVNRITNTESAWGLWSPSWSKVDAPTLRDAAINRNADESVGEAFRRRR